jgi:hypothetical protein
MFRVMKSRTMRWAGHAVCMGDMRSTYKVLVSEVVGKRLLGRSGHRWEDNIGTNFREVGWEVWTGCIWLRIETSGRLL